MLKEIRFFMMYETGILQITFMTYKTNKPDYVYDIKLINPNTFITKINHIAFITFKIKNKPLWFMYTT